MKKFQFSLQPLQSLREREEQRALLEYAKMVAELQEARARLRMIDLELDACSRFMQSRCCPLSERGVYASSTSASTWPASELAQLQDYILSLSRQKALSERMMKAANENFQVALTNLLSARKASAVLSKHREIQRRTHVRRQNKHEQKLLDEISQRRPPAEAMRRAGSARAEAPPG